MQIDLPTSRWNSRPDTFRPVTSPSARENAGPTTHEFEVLSVPDGVDLDQFEIVDDVADVDAAGPVA